METATVTREIHISTLNLKPGTYVTIHADGEPIEIRVTPTGKVEIYSDKIKVIHKFDDWYNIS